ncbi:MAG: O-antigen ligase family protein [Rhodobacterales bacterium]
MTAVDHDHGDRMPTRRPVPLAFSRASQPLSLPLSTGYMAFAALVFFAAHGGFYRFLGLGTPVWLLAYCVVFLWAIRAPRQVMAVSMQIWPVLCLPAFALLSTVWSVDAPRTPVAAMYLFMTTLITVRISMVLSTRQTMIALVFGVGIGVVLSMINMQIAFFTPVYEKNGALLGIYSQKTQLGKAAFWTAFAVVAVCAFYRIRLVGLITSLICLPIPFWALSVTGKLGFLFVGLMMLMIAMRRLPMGLRLGMPFILVALVLSYAVIHVMTGGAIMADLLDFLGKDSTLTGRGLIWAIGYEVWSDSPLVGIGFNAFWSSPSYASMVHVISSAITEGLTGFHNAYVEAFVALGALGGLWFVGIVLLTLWRLLRAYLVARTLDSIIWFCAMLAVAMLGMMEDSLFKPHSGHWMIFVLAYCRSLSAVKLGYASSRLRR